MIVRDIYGVLLGVGGRKHHCNKKKNPAFTVPFKRPARVISNAMSRFLLATVTAGAITVDRSEMRPTTERSRVVNKVACSHSIGHAVNRQPLSCSIVPILMLEWCASRATAS